MSDAAKAIPDSDLRQSEAALRRAAQKALELGQKTHTPVFVLHEGKVIDLTAEPDEPPPCEAPEIKAIRD
jgi:hypothetical protein